MTTTHDATTNPIIPVTFIWPSGEDIADLDVADPVILSDQLEQIDIGGGGVLHGLYLRITGPDLVLAAEELRRLADRIQCAVMDARQDRLDAQRHACWCGVLLEPDEDTCGAASCRHMEMQDRQGLIP